MIIAILFSIAVLLVLMIVRSKIRKKAIQEAIRLRRIMATLKLEIRRGSRKKAIILHHDMGNKYRELVDDPTMSYLKWKEWLPVFEAADARCRQLDLGVAIRLGNISDKVRQIIRDDGYKKDI